MIGAGLIGKIATSAWTGRLVIVAVICLLLGVAYIGYDRMASIIEHQSEQIATLTRSVGVLEDNNKQLLGAISSTNLALAELSVGIESTTKSFATLSSNVNTKISELNKKLQRVDQTPLPSTADQTIDYLIQQAAEIHK